MIQPLRPLQATRTTRECACTVSGPHARAAAIEVYHQVRRYPRARAAARVGARGAVARLYGARVRQARARARGQPEDTSRSQSFSAGKRSTGILEFQPSHSRYFIVRKLDVYSKWNGRTTFE